MNLRCAIQHLPSGTVTGPPTSPDVPKRRWLRNLSASRPYLARAATPFSSLMHCSPHGIANPVAGRLVDFGVPILLPHPAMAEHDELGHQHDHGHKAAQTAHFDRPGEEEFEIDRPHGTPRLYRFLLAEKFRRATGPIRPHLFDASVLTVCGGSGMDAEFFPRAGASVTSSDLSLGPPAD